MATNSAIEWTEATWNPIAGCTPVSSGCLHCYAATMAHRLDAMGQAKYAGLTVLRNGIRTFNGKINLDESALSIPLKRKKPTVYFVNSMSDLFHESVPFEFIDKVFAVMALCPQHTFQVLTKRPERMAEWLNDRRSPMGFKTDECVRSEMIPENANFHPVDLWKRFQHPLPSETTWPLPNVWLGTSVENQKAADERIPHLLECEAAVRFLSCEPLLGGINLKLEGLNQIDWVIVGGESGPGARPCNIDWMRSIAHQCKAAGLACFVKQLGSKPYDGAAAAAVPGARRPITRAAMAIPEAAEQAAEVLEQCCEAMTEIHFQITDKKGGDIAEFPADLRVREFPKGVVSAGG